MRGESAGLIARPRLVRTLTTLAPRKLALLTAPGGYGKSTLITALMEDSPGASFCWILLDPADASLPIFLHHLAQAVAPYLPVHSPATWAADAALTDGASIRQMGRLAAQELASHTEERLILVFDDLHHLTGCAPAFAFLDAFIQSLPPSVQMVAASRTVPSLPLARLKAQGQMIHITATDLAFTADEAQAFFDRRFGIQLTADLVEQLLERTEGWVTGLLLLGNLWQGLPSSEWRRMLTQFPTGGAIFDYLAQEVFDQQAPDVQEFLLSTCVLEPLQPYVIERMLGVPQAGQLLQQLEARNLFIVRDGVGGAPRYHHLFAAFLRQQLAARRGEAAARELHLLAGRTQEGLGDLTAAIDQYLLAGEWAQAARLMAERVDVTLKSLHHEVVRGWLARLPAHLSDENPDVIYVRAQLAAWRAQHDGLPALYQRCLELYEQQGDIAGFSRTLSWVLNRFWKLRHPYFFEAPRRWAAHPVPEIAVYGRMLIALTRIGRGEWEEAVVDLEAILADIPPATRAYFDCMETLAVLSFWRADAQRTLRYGIACTAGRTALGDFAWGLYVWSGYCLMADSQGLEHYQRQFLGLEVGPSMERLRQLIGLLGQGLIHMFHRRWAESVACFEAISGHFCDVPGAQQVLGSEATFLARLEMARGYLKLGRLSDAERCVLANVTLSQAYPELAALGYAQLAELHIIKGDLRGARHALLRAEAALPAGLEGLSSIAVGVVAAKLEAAAGADEVALERLTDAAEQSRVRGCPWWLLHCGGPEVLPLLQRLTEQTLPSGAHGHAIFQMVADLGDQAGPIFAPLLSHPSADVREAARIFVSHLQQHQPISAPTVKIYLMGPLRAYRYDQPVGGGDWHRTKVRLLLTALLLRQGKPITRETLMALLWPDAAPASARSSLRATMHGLKRSLEPDLGNGEESQFIASQRETLALARIDEIWCDLWEFEEAIVQARAAARAGRHAVAMRHYQTACDMTQGTFLPEPAFAEYFVDLRTRVERSFLEACLYVGEMALKGQDYALAMEYGRRALSLDRACEEAYQVLIRAYLARGDRDKAMQVYRTCMKHLRQVAGQAPSAETVRLLEA